MESRKALNWKRAAPAVRNEIPDHAAAVRQLAAERPYMDIGRVGIFGSSWGGYFTVRAMLLEPDLYKVGVATSPLIVLSELAVAIEPYMGLPAENAQGYDYGSNVRLAPNLKGNLLIIHGTGDLAAPFSGTMQLAEAFVRANESFDLIVLPEQRHGFSADVQDYWLDALRTYFQEHLGP